VLLAIGLHELVVEEVTDMPPDPAAFGGAWVAE
jgi:hypothetical protein